MSSDPAGVRARIGLIIPSSNVMVEPHFSRHAPDGVVPHFARLRMTGKYRMPLAELAPRIEEAAATLADARCDPIVFHCTANSMAEGVAAEKDIVRVIEDATGRRAATTAGAVLAALAALDARRIVLVSPYNRATHEHELDFMAEAGIEIADERNLDLGGSDGYVAAPAETWREVLCAMKNAGADAYFASCANIRAIDVLDETEAALGRPVLTSNQIVLWHALRLAGISDPVPGIGRLLRDPAPAA